MQARELIVELCRQFADSMADAMAAHPQANAVLVERHGVYVWGKDWVETKTQAECYDYLFEAAVRMRQLGLDPAAPPAATLETQENR